MIKRISLFIYVLLMLANSESVFATHIRAGEIIVERKNAISKTFIFYITGYVDLITGEVPFGGGMLDFGDGSQPIDPIRDHDRVEILNDADVIDSGNGVGLTRFRVEHTYSGNGIYIVSYREPNRNEGVLNMDNSVNTPFYVESVVRIDSYLGVNNSPAMLIPPIDYGCTGVAFFHNPGAYDVDGDSIAFEFITPRKSAGTNVDNYRAINDGAFNGAQEVSGIVPATFEIDPVTGDVVWNAPGLAGEYNIAFKVTEYRRKNGEYLFMGSVVRDMQILIEDCDNERPRLEIPEDICVEAGTDVNQIITATDADGDMVKLEVFSQVLNFPNSPAQYSPNPAIYQNQPGEIQFNWTTDCSHVREQPYLVTFKVSDQPEEGRPLVEFGTMRITVVAPAPEVLSATVNPDRSINLTWNEYLCSNAESIQIWRRVDNYDFIPDECELGIPEYAGYQLLDVVSPSITNYKDDNLGKLLAFDANYCYRLVAVFPKPEGGESYVSTEVCGIIRADGPAITHVTVDKTDTEAGEITISWRGPFEIDQVLFPPPYEYELWRGLKFAGAATQKVMSLSQDTTFLDTGLNTAEEPYNYIVKLFDGSGQIVRESVSASSVYLEPKPGYQVIELAWNAQVPWSNNTQDYPTHVIYRDQVDSTDPAALVKIAEVNVNNDGFSFVDDGSIDGKGLDDKTLYCYYVKVFGSYGNPKIASPQENWSQIICAQPNDTIPPCTPNIHLVANDCSDYLADKDCDYSSFYNTIAWTYDYDIEGCKDDLKGYNVYYSVSGNDESFEQIAFVNATEFQQEGDSIWFEYTHLGLRTFAGCYYVTALDRSGNESSKEESEIVCNDNCPFYVLPNVFTPNGDNHNDFFEPLNANSDYPNAQCPRFVISVDFRVFDRLGNEVYSSEGNPEKSIYIRWDGRNNSGVKVTSGVYYYAAEVVYDVRLPEDQNETLNGWVSVMY